MKPFIKVGVVGARKRNTPADKKIIKDILVKQMEKYQIKLVSGGCPRGADRFAEELAKELGLDISIHYPNIPNNAAYYEVVRANYDRNTLIAQECDVLLALPSDSGGTLDTIHKAENLKKPVIIR